MATWCAVVCCGVLEAWCGLLCAAKGFPVLCKGGAVQVASQSFDAGWAAWPTTCQPAEQGTSTKLPNRTKQIQRPCSVCWLVVFFGRPSRYNFSQALLLCFPLTFCRKGPIRAGPKTAAIYQVLTYQHPRSLV
ncbi:hypothetical protein BD289DRAFT_107428 [Coniella lustricola]|uniref:Secreted protein n=1 Tax=Coniella lustricola TaxID=2025994 RepID=A0A2T3AGI0_9PEZI|nr:hypothetical protein BD289DRAFT_107428 [Coniella lustricola]